MKNNNPDNLNSNINKKAKALICNYYEYYIMTVGILGQSMHYIQAYKIFSTQSAEDISLPAYLICLFLLVNWLIYGAVKKAKTLIYAEVLGAVFPKTEHQLCIVHQIRNSLRYVSYKNRKELAGDLKHI